MYRVICSIVLFVVLPLSAQDSFVTLDWQELPPVRTLPMITEDVPLPDDFRFYSYDVKLEFPEFAAIDQETVDEFTKKKVELPETPCLTTHIGIADNKGYLSVSFIPVVFRDPTFLKQYFHPETVIPFRPEKIEKLELSMPGTGKPTVEIELGDVWLE